MTTDFQTILAIGTLVTGIILLIDKMLFAGKRQLAIVDKTDAKAPFLVELSRTFFPVLLIVLILRSFLIEPFRIPSGSMLPNLLINDFIVVNKFTYGVRLPVIHRKVFEIKAPQRGDVAVFRHPIDNTNFIKRVVGIPGDVIEYKDKQLLINGKPLAMEPNGTFLEEGVVISKFSEWIDEVKHDILLNNRIRPTRDIKITVPDGQYFMMGDNRDNSSDSRVWGFVPEENLIGKAFAIWMSWNNETSSVVPIRWERLGKTIQ